MKNLLLMFLLVTGCSANKAEEADRSSANKKTGNQSNSNADGDFDEDSEKSNRSSRSNDSRSNRDRSSGDCNLDFSDSIEDEIASSGRAKAPLIGSINYNLKADSKIDIYLNGDNAEIGLDANIVSFTPAIARSTAENVINSYKDPLQLTVMAESDWEDLKEEDSNWAALDCIVIPVTRIKNDTYDYEFDPALPMLASPKANLDEVSSKLKGGLTIRGIKSNLKRHFQPRNIAVPGQYVGGARVKISGDSLSIDYDFGTAAPEALATPLAGLVFDINESKQNYDRVVLKAFVADDSKIDLELSK